MHYPLSGDQAETKENTFAPASPLSDTFLNTLAAELDNDDIVGIILGGSYARGEATRYSDVDIACFMKDEVKPPPKRFMYRDSRLVSIAAKGIADVRDSIKRPNTAIFVVPGLRHYRLLLDKNGAVEQLLREIETFSWEPLQQAADQYASLRIMLLAEWAHKLMSELLKRDELALSYVLSEFLFSATEAVAVQRGVLVKSDNTYYRQVQESVGRDSAWTAAHRRAVGLGAVPKEGTSIQARSVAALDLYQETVKLLRPVLHPDHLVVAEQAARVIDEASHFLALG